MDNQLIFWYRHTTDNTKTHETNSPVHPWRLRMSGWWSGEDLSVESVSVRCDAER